MEEVQKHIKGLVSPTTRRGRAIRTALQAFISIGTFLYGLLTIPGLEQFLYDQGAISTLGAFSVWTGVVAYIQNAAESLFKYLWGE